MVKTVFQFEVRPGLLDTNNARNIPHVATWRFFTKNMPSLLQAKNCRVGRNLIREANEKYIEFFSGEFRIGWVAAHPVRQHARFLVVSIADRHGLEARMLVNKIAAALAYDAITSDPYPQFMN